MKIEDFWSLTESIDLIALGNGHEGDAVAPLIQVLASLPPKEIRSYAEHLAGVLYRLDGENYANHTGDSGRSGDGFLYCRCYVVAKGKAYYQTILSNPSAMPKTIEEWCEPLLYVPAKAWARRTKNNAADWDFETTVSYETGSNLDQWPNLIKEEEDPFVEPKLEKAAARAGHHFRSKEYGHVVKLLEQHEVLLSKKQLLMLNEARANQGQDNE
ncbi:MAG: hypothetical protein QG657_440 [Acidobacteriota bacterium]|nr:hypothetical protein [Acidobacteriota bacterium]